MLFFLCVNVYFPGVGLIKSGPVLSALLLLNLSLDSFTTTNNTTTNSTTTTTTVSPTSLFHCHYPEYLSDVVVNTAVKDATTTRDLNILFEL